MLLVMAPLIVLFEALSCSRRCSIVAPSARAPARRPSGRRRRRSTADDAIPTTTDRPMLFDLRGRGRRRTVKVIYLTLAILMGGGLVLFGIGGDVPAACSTRSPGATAAATPAPSASRSRSSGAEAAARANPDDAARLGGARARALPARAPATTTTRAPAPTPRGQAELRRPRRLGALPGARPRQAGRRVASLMVQAYGRRSTTSTRPRARRRSSPRRANRAGAYSQLAMLAYQAGQTRKGDLAARQGGRAHRARTMRETLEGQLEAARRRRAQAARRHAAADGRAARRLSAARRYTRPPRPCSSTGRAADS